MRLPCMIAGILFSILAVAVSGAPLDQTRIHSLYYSGKVDSASAMIEAFMKNNVSFPRADSLFVAKYLSVIYSADPAKKAEGERFMRQWLAMEPTAEIRDMYASDEVDSLFRTLKAQQRDNRSTSHLPGSVGARKADSADAAKQIQNPAPASGHSVHTSKKRIKPWVWAALGGGVTATVGAFFLVEGMNSNNPSPPQNWTLVVKATEE